MTEERPDIEAVVIPPAGAGDVLLTGAAEFVADAILDLDLEIDHFRREVAQDGAGITCVRINLDGESPGEIRDRMREALADLIRETSELAGWGSRVGVVEPLDDHEEEPPRTADLDAEAAKILPSGDQIARSLLQDIEHERSVYDDSEKFRACPLAALSTADVDSLTGTDREEALRRASALAGCLIQAAVTIVDHLYEDITEMRQHTEAGTAAEIEDTWILSGLPGRYRAGYSALFAQQFLAAMIDLTGRLTRGWEPLACVAQELGLRLLLDEVESVADAADVILDDGWRGHLEELLFEDVDHEYLYDPAHDGIEHHPASQPPGMAPMRFEDWFRPFNPERTLPPYALPDPPSTDD